MSKKKHNKDPKVLIWDIETLMNKGYFFSLFDDRGNNPNFILKERSIITIAYKWYGEREAHVMSVADYPKVFKKDPYNDKQLVSDFIKIMEQADYMVAHYGDKFDSKFVSSRALINNVSPPPKVQTIDTYKLVKKHFNLNANRLDYIGKLLGLGGKMPMNWSYWVKCAEGCEKSVKKMAAYNKQDVQLLEAVFKKLLPHVESKLNIRLFTESHCCAGCGSDHIQMRGSYVTKQNKHHRYQCQDCGKWGVLGIQEGKEILGKYTAMVLSNEKSGRSK